MPYRIRQWWGYKTQMEKILMVLLAFSIFIIIVLASVMKHNVQRKPPESCSNLTCLTEAIKIKRYTDPKTNPCDDFYQFVCGNFMENSNEEERLPFLVLQAEQLIDVCNELIRPDDHVLIKLVKKLYQTCTDSDGFNTNSKQTLKNTLAAGGGWPVLEGSKWDEKNFDWKNASYKFAELGYYDEFFVYVNLDRDAINKTNFILEVLVADAYDYRYGIIGLDKAQIMAEVAVILGAEGGKKVLDELNEAHNFQQALQALVYNKQHQEHAHHKYTISEYQTLCDSINWLEFINNMLGPNIQVKADQTVWFPPPEIFKKWFDIVLSVPKRVQANYIMWKVVERVLPYLTRELQYSKLGLQKSQNRKNLCMDLIVDMGLLYPTQIALHKKFVSNDTKKSLQDLLSNMKTELVQSLNRSTVFKMAKKEEALSAIKSLRIEVFPSENYFNDEIFNKLATKIVVLPVK